MVNSLEKPLALLLGLSANKRTNNVQEEGNCDGALNTRLDHVHPGRTGGV